jgi:hypothetical protein
MIDVIDERLNEFDPDGTEQAGEIRELRQLAVGLRHVVEDGV